MRYLLQLLLLPLPLLFSADPLTAEPPFEETTTAAGIDYAGMTYGPAAADFDGDGFPDVAVSRHAVAHLWHNRGDGTFRPYGTFPEGDTHGLAWVDLDDDGRLDLYVSLGASRGFGKGPNQWLRGLAEGGFALVGDAPETLLDPNGRGRCSLPHDFDGDGVLDLLLANTYQKDREHRLVSGKDRVDLAPASGLKNIAAECFAVVGLHGADVAPTLVAYGAGRDRGRAYRRDKTGRFTDVTAELGLDGMRNLQAVAAGDYDNDGDLDLYLAAGFGIPPQVLAQPRSVRFRLISEGTTQNLRFRAPPRWTADFRVLGPEDPVLFLGKDRVAVVPPATIETADPRLAGAPVLDPKVDRGAFLHRAENGEVVLLFLGDRRFRAAAGEMHAAAGSFKVSEITPPVRDPNPQPNRLFENRDGRFVDVTEHAGVGDGRSARDAFFFDFDNDGDLDLFLVNGGTAFENQPDVLYRNRGDGTFETIEHWGRAEKPAAGRGAGGLAFDYDGDGALDLFFANGDGPEPGNEGRTTLWRNRAAVGRFARLDLRGPAGNRQAMGAQVLARYPDGRKLLLERTAGTGRFNTSVLPLHFGLGNAEEIEVEVRWPSGERETLRLKAGQRDVATANTPTPPTGAATLRPPRSTEPPGSPPADGDSTR